MTHDIKTVKYKKKETIWKKKKEKTWLHNYWQITYNT